MVSKVAFRNNFTRALGEISIPFVAVSSAGFANVVVMRYNEALEGVKVTDSEGNVYGKSRKAGQIGVGMCGLTRVFMPIIYLIITPGVVRVLEHMRMYPTARLPKELANIAVVCLSLQVAVGPGLALFP